MTENFAWADAITKDMIENFAWADGGPNEAIDVVTVTYEGKRYRIDIVPDLDSSPTDYECYDEADIEAWRNNNWSYVGVIVTPLDVPEDKQFGLSDSLWGLEYHFPLNPPQTHNGVRYVSTNTDYQVMVYPVPDMLSEVIAGVKKWEAETAYKNYALS